MSDKKQNKSSRNTWIQYGIFALVATILYATGMHTEVIGFAQRGLLTTGIMNPNVKKITNSRSEDVEKADLNVLLIDEDGNSKSLADLKGKVIFINFWATWCPPCIAEMPSISKLHQEMGDDIAFVMLSFDKDFETAKAFNKRKGYNLPIYSLGSNLPSMFQSSALPTTYIIDAEGYLVLTHKKMADYNNRKFKKFLTSLK